MGRWIPGLVVLVLFYATLPGAGAAPLQMATFQCDATPPVGSPLCHGSIVPVHRVVDPLQVRGVVFHPEGQAPLVLCAVDWVLISNGAHDAWRDRLAAAAGTTRDRVAVQTLHQHDAPGPCYSTETLLQEQGLTNRMCNLVHARQVLDQTVAAVAEAGQRMQPVSQVAFGKGRVEKFASNRRPLGPDGKVKFVRFSACRNPAIRAEPEGVIDPFARVVALGHGGSQPVALTYYATHPQSYYGGGSVSADTVGLARTFRDMAVPGTFHVHFNGAGGNITAGKYNDGSPTNRVTLARRLASGLERAWQQLETHSLKTSDIEWRVESVTLPVRETLRDPESRRRILADENQRLPNRIFAARDLVFARRMNEGHKIDIACLKLGPVYILHLPGELFVEYQLAAQQLRPDAFVCLAAYGDGGPGYIGDRIAYTQGGYEVGRVSRVAPEVEDVLMGAMRKLVQ